MTTFSTILDHRVKFIVPDMDKNGERVLNTPVVEWLKKEVNQHLGGERETVEDSQYLSRDKETIEQTSTIVESSFSSANLVEFSRISVEYAIKLIQDLNQECVAVEIDGRLVIVGWEPDIEDIYPREAS